LSLSSGAMVAIKRQKYKLLDENSSN